MAEAGGPSECNVARRIRLSVGLQRERVDYHRSHSGDAQELWHHGVPTLRGFWRLLAPPAQGEGQLELRAGRSHRPPEDALPGGSRDPETRGPVLVLLARRCHGPLGCHDPRWLHFAKPGGSAAENLATVVRGGWASQTKRREGQAVRGDLRMPSPRGGCRGQPQDSEPARDIARLCGLEPCLGHSLRATVGRVPCISGHLWHTLGQLR
mmetsp:Transcript_93497/g.237979  ORF Transcript_93497/g.237979 Transcript_93497/m.237979 type:complete len:209 (-) Transcript_93497:611-1237(-)